MPEMKRNFTGGKMNKDLDERFISSGDYRSATNVQVSTSDEDNVGTVQNILGNSPGCTYDGGNINPINEGSITIGSISDEKNDSLYWLVSDIKSTSTLVTGQTISPFLQPYFSFANILSPDPSGSYTSKLFKDIIMRTNISSPSGCEPVLVDVYRILTYNDNSTGTNENNISLYDPNIISNISAGMEVYGWDATGVNQWNTIVESAGILQSIPLYYESPIDHTSVATPALLTATSDPTLFGLGYGFGWGCTDPLASNYDSSVFADDGSCILEFNAGGAQFQIPGCTNVSATNYDPNANFDDGSCIY
jgi:hypothetical protein